MSYLIYADYKRLIQSDSAGSNLQQIIGQDPTTLTQAEGTALEEATSRLRQKFDISQEFKDTAPWNISAMYQATDRVYIDAPLFSATNIYTAGDMVTYAVSPSTVNVYYATLDVVSPGPFVPSQWFMMGSQYQLFYAAYPNPPFNLYTQYVVGDLVYYKGNIYRCLIQTTPRSQETELQYRLYENERSLNVFPDNVNYGSDYWAFVSTYSVPPDTLITNTDYWTRGDNRSQLIVTNMVACVLYWIHFRIAPRNIPDLRVKGYDDAIKWFKQCANGDVTPNLPVIQPRAGARIRFGGPIKNINSY